MQCSKQKAREAIFYSYTKHINGFAANLDAATAAEIAGEPASCSFFLPASNRPLIFFFFFDLRT
jgi:hypothetical protein